MLKYIVEKEFMFYDKKSHCCCGMTDYCFFCGSEPFKIEYNTFDDCGECVCGDDYQEFIECEKCKEYEKNYRFLKKKLEMKEIKMIKFIDKYFIDYYEHD